MEYYFKGTVSRRNKTIRKSIFGEIVYVKYETSNNLPYFSEIVIVNIILSKK